MGVGVLVAAVATGVGIAVNKVQKHQTAKRLDVRESFEDTDIYQRFYAEDGCSREAIAELWHEVAQTLHAPPQKMRPDDVLGKDVGACWIKCKEVDALRQRATERAQTQAITIDWSTIRTVDDYVRHFARSAA